MYTYTMVDMTVVTDLNLNNFIKLREEKTPGKITP